MSFKNLRYPRKKYLDTECQLRILGTQEKRTYTKNVDTEIPKTNVTRFLEENEISHEIFIAGAKGTDMMEKTGLNPKNILPFTILVDKRLDVIEKKVGKITKDELLYWVDSVER